MKPHLLLLAATLLLAIPSSSAATRRLVVIKVDGLGYEVLNHWLHQKSPSTGKSALPWIQHVFIEGGTCLANFYVRGISLSVPSWSMLDTGRPPVIHGNAEFDRTDAHVYDYLNFFPFYFSNARNARADMPGVEVLDEAGIPLFIDFYKPAERLQGMQLFERGVRWQTVRSLLRRRFGRSPRELFNEWQTGFELSEALGQQLESEMLSAIAKSDLLYLDYFFGDYDHVAHLANDAASQRLVLEKLDRLVGRIWTAIGASPLMAETTLVLASDHGMNSDPEIYSQGFNLVNFFGSAAAGGHHVMTNRHPESEYKLKGLDPFVSEVITPSRESLYLRGEADEYPTVFLDLDGNERAAIYLRNSDLNAMHILLKDPVRKTEQILEIIDSHREEWKRTEDELESELAALKRSIERRREAMPPRQGKVSPDDTRRKVEVELWERQLHRYSDHVKWLHTMLNASAEEIASPKIKIETLIPKRSMMQPNSIYQLQHYVVDASRQVDYFQLLLAARVRNNVQPGVESRPVDFIALRVPAGALPPEERPDRDAIWLYGGEDQQALILSRQESLRYLAVRRLKQDSRGRITFERQGPAQGFPLRYFEDAALDVAGDRAEWLQGWHTWTEWFRATHATRYSNAIVGLAQHFAPAELGSSSALWEGAGADEPLLRRFALRLRNMTASDLLVMANDHWNFNVRGFNPGGNHGSFLRASTHSVLLFAGAGIPTGQAIERPYDSLSFVPTLLALTGRGGKNHFPGPVIEEITGALRP